ncbi:hypothetical protein COO59_01880 [Mixta theicola]|uniref:Lysozyme inhibitor LprI-like N-terminal domain-containing protein n=1 Tax=Mixta theicola TaxID=1458355 RepID=A0A2K1QEX2_9GAMM|nr:lysozyme inhibitor LprI family protein [Mixta theicola]PNS13586.1 hypothetical protein COO59_01880 [Mixta theicola]GLR09908.1 hypothetical protein GCM10007905_26280 [Mixta theicola]
MKLTALLLLSLTLPAVGLAALPGANIDKQLQGCKQHANSTIDNAQCYSSAIQQWDSELNKQYQLLLKGQPKSVRQKITAAQRSWLQYRDGYNAAISAYYQQQQGTIWPLVAAEAKMNVIRDKTIDLYKLRVSTDLAAEQE